MQNMALSVLEEKYNAISHIDALGASTVRLHRAAMAVNPSRNDDVNNLVEHINQVRDEFDEVAMALAADAGIVADSPTCATVRIEPSV